MELVDAGKEKLPVLMSRPGFRVSLNFLYNQWSGAKRTPLKVTHLTLSTHFCLSAGLILQVYFLFSKKIT